MMRRLVSCLMMFFIALMSAIALPAIAKNTPDAWKVLNHDQRPLTQKISPNFLSKGTLETPPSLKEVGKNQDLSNPQTPEQQAKQLYESGQFADAVELLKQTLQHYKEQNDSIGQAIIYSNLALNYQQLGSWDAATQSIDSALTLLNQSKSDISVRAQVLDVQGSVYLARGNTDQAVQSWQQAAALYQQAKDFNRAALSQINQSHALMTSGLFRRAIALLSTLQPTLQTQPNSLTKAEILRSLGDALQIAGSLEQAEQALQQSLAMGKRLKSAEIIAAANLSLGNVAIAHSKIHVAYGKTKAAQLANKTALNYYQSAEAATPLSQAQALLNQLSLLLNLPADLMPQMDRWAEVTNRYAQLQKLVPDLPSGRPTITLQLGLGQHLMHWRDIHPANAPTWKEIAQGFAIAMQQAKTLNDPRTLSEALGSLGSVYTKTAQWSEAESLTQQALLLAQAVDATDIAYRWQRQLGQVVCRGAQPCSASHVRDAIATYTEAFKSLQSLRRDLVAVNPDVQFSFRESIEPIYRELVDLLLQDNAGNPSQQNLQQARNILEALQVAELENFLQTGCQSTKLQIDRVIDQDDPTAAVIYPIILGDRLEVILKLPGKTDLYRYPPTYLSKQSVNETLDKLRVSLQEEYSFEEVKHNAKTVYDWLIRPAANQLEASGIKTLIFVLDGPLRMIPMAVLYDGEHYLVEKYAAALILGLEVREPEPIHRERLKVLAASLTDPPKGFEQLYGRLENVNPELDQIQKKGIPATFIRDQTFTQAKLSQEIKANNFKVVHLATHGQFGASRESTYLLTADGAMYVDQLSDVFNTRNQNRADAIELLILSACKTATGSNRAVLGIAGTTVRAGAHSAIASLWSLADAPSVQFTQQLYANLGEPGVTRAEALRRAQVNLLHSTDIDYSHPRFWASYVLIGSWL